MTEPVALRTEEREVALAEAQAVHALAADADYRERLASLVAAVDEGALDAEDASTLEGVLELALQSGRIRALYGPGGEQAALRLYRRLPGGSEMRASAAAVSDAISALAGRRLESLRVEAVGPGSFSLALAVDGAELAIRLDRQGARVASVGA